MMLVEIVDGSLASSLGPVYDLFFTLVIQGVLKLPWQRMAIVLMTT
jgi:hypothetical protein